MEFQHRRRGRRGAEGGGGDQDGEADGAGPLRNDRPEDWPRRGRRLGPRHAPHVTSARHGGRGPERSFQVVEAEEDAQPGACPLEAAAWRGTRCKGVTMSRWAPSPGRSSCGITSRARPSPSGSSRRKARRHRAQILAVRQVPRFGVPGRAVPRPGRALRVQARRPDGRRREPRRRRLGEEGQKARRREERDDAPGLVLGLEARPDQHRGRGPGLLRPTVRPGPERLLPRFWRATGRRGRVGRTVGEPGRVETRVPARGPQRRRAVQPWGLAQRASVPATADVGRVRLARYLASVGVSAERVYRPLGETAARSAAAGWRAPGRRRRRRPVRFREDKDPDTAGRTGRTRRCTR